MRNFFLLFLFLSFSIVVFAETFPLKTREQKSEAYLDEFASQAFKESYKDIYAAIKNALTEIPQYAFEKVTDRTFPVVFTEVPYSGMGKWANSAGIFVEPNDPPTFTKGIWIVKLNTQMNEVNSVEAIEGVVLHELAHKVLEHQGGTFNPEIEREANRLVKKWGFERQFLKAKEFFGAKATH